MSKQSCTCGKPGTIKVKGIDGRISYMCAKCFKNFRRFCEAMARV